MGEGVRVPLSYVPVKSNPVLRKIGIHADMDDGHFDYIKLSNKLKEHLRLNDEHNYLSLIRDISRQDLWFFCYFCLDLPVNHPFLMARCFEVQKKHHMCIDLWAREHWKSTIISHALVLWELINNPEERIGIFSNTKPLAKTHMFKSKMAMEKNEVMKGAFPDIFYNKPDKEAPRWSLDDGIYVKRKGNFGEASIEAWGLVDSQPVGKHFSILNYDDVVDLRGVNSPDMIAKATLAYKMSLNLGTSRGVRRIIGTRYNNNDSYSQIMKLARWTSRIYPGEVDDEGKAKLLGTPIYLSRKELDEKHEEMGEYVYGSQILQNPVAASEQKFQLHWLRYWQKTKPYLNLYIIVDPANSKKRSSDFTVMSVLGTDSQRNYWLVDMIRDKLDLGERWEKLKELVQSYGVNTVGYEKYGMQADIDYMQLKMEEDGVFFNIIELGGNVPKSDRIKKLIPIFQKGRFIIPRSLPYTTVKGDMVDLTHSFLQEEYTTFPYCTHDDMLDDMARITEPAMGVTFPNRVSETITSEMRNDPLDMHTDHDSLNWLTQ